LPVDEYVDIYGNPVKRLMMTPGPLVLRYDAICAVPDEPDLDASASFGDLVRRYRVAAGLTQEELAEMAGTLARHRQCQLALAGELAGVAQKVEQALLELGAIGADVAEVLRQSELERIAVFLGERNDERANLFEPRSYSRT